MPVLFKQKCATSAEESTVRKDLLFIPGPVTCAEPVLAAMARPMIDHRGPAFAGLLNGIATRMKPIFGTVSDVVLLGASGTGGLEAAVGNLFGPGDTVLACPVGVFGQRLIAIAKQFGCNVEVLETPWGSALDPARLEARLAADRDRKITGILLTHNETSTGVQNDLAPLATLTRAHGAYTVVDSVSGLGATDFRMDSWGFDIVVTATQKVFGVPPGIAIVAVSPRSWVRMNANLTQRFYFDLKKAKTFADLGQTPWTPPVSIVYALDVALGLYEQEGASNVWQRHARNAQALRAAASALDLEVFSRDGAHSVTVVAVNNPSGIDGDAVRKRLREEHGFVLGGGQQELKGKIMRIGTMGAVAQDDFLAMLTALESALADAGHPVRAGVAAAAARNVFGSSYLSV
jgi:aspartate aminotransferase-like enzyme